MFRRLLSCFPNRDPPFPPRLLFFCLVLDFLSPEKFCGLSLLLRPLRKLSHQRPVSFRVLFTSLLPHFERHRFGHFFHNGFFSGFFLVLLELRKTLWDPKTLLFFSPSSFLERFPLVLPPPLAKVTQLLIPPLKTDSARSFFS